MDNSYLVSVLSFGDQDIPTCPQVFPEKQLLQPGRRPEECGFYVGNFLFSSRSRPPALGIKMAQRMLSGDSSVGDLPSSYLLPSFWSLLPASRSRKASAETVGLTLLYAEVPSFPPGLLHSDTVPNTNMEKRMLPHTHPWAMSWVQRPGCGCSLYNQPWSHTRVTPASTLENEARESPRVLGQPKLQSKF